MANCSITSRPYAGLPGNSAADRERARELYKYFRPPERAEPIDTVLTAHSQLAAWRLNADRAMVSVIDEETQYFVAESTKTVHLDDAEKYDVPEDAIWAGCVRAPKAGRLCEHTIATPPPPEGGPACFEVLDLSKDERFHQLPFVAGDPHFKYYAGVPLRTRRGINIGSIYILDRKLRAPLTRSEKHFLGVMADNVIQHLEMLRDKKDRQRTFRMNECLSAYVDPAPEHAKRRRRSSENSQSAETDSDADSKRTADGGARIEVFTRAAELLREAMDVEEGGGGVLYLDTAPVAVPSQHPVLGGVYSGEKTTATALKNQEPPSSRKHSAEADIAVSESRSRLPSLDLERKRVISTETLAHTFQAAGKSVEQPEFLSFAPEELLKIIKRYPRGRMFTYDQQGQELSDSSDNESIFHGQLKPKRQRQRSAADAANLRIHFPQARQIMFIPIWDSTTGRPAACFIYNCSEYRNFTHQMEFMNSITFNNCVDGDLLRLSNLKTSEQKNNFIGSISHELRSPLHGILASCEFLQDTKCTSFQQSLVKTAESCARTLLDTVNMVLDYSKINAFEKEKSDRTARDLNDDVPSKSHEAFKNSLNAHRNINLAMLTEEVVEGVATGHKFNDAQDALSYQTVVANTSNDTENPRKPGVELIVDISRQDWTYWCEPGSIRRVVMNLVGNALKYTQKGFVHVKLDYHTAELNSSEEGTLTVTDSGQGISPTYLKNKLFTPFAQESNQAPGIGLGLSLVKSIVDNMGGQIDVESAVGVGTKVTVKFPLIRKPSSKVNAGGSELETTTNKAPPSMRQGRNAEVSVATYWRKDEATTGEQQKASQLLRKTLTSYLEDWAGDSVGEWQERSAADIIVVEEAALDDLTRRFPSLTATHCRNMVLVLRGAGSAESANSTNIENIRHPVGPHKLARALQACVERSKDISTNATEPLAPIESLTSATVNLSITVEETSQLTATINEDLKSAEEGMENRKYASAPTVSLKPHDVMEKQSAATVSELLSPTRRILLVDDNAINLRLLQVGMKKHGYKSISSASDGLQAVNTYRTLLRSYPPAPPDIILMDLSMPVMDGFDATRKIREIEAEYNSAVTPEQARHHSLIIALTGLASVRDQKEAYNAGVDSYVMKPVSFAKLTKLLEDWTVNGKAAAVEVVSDTI